MSIISRTMLSLLERFSLTMPEKREDLLAQMPCPSKHFGYLVKALMNALGPIVWGYEVYGTANLKSIPDGQGCIFAANHTSYVDALFLGSALPFEWLSRVSILSKVELFRGQIMYPIMRMAGGIPVERGGDSEIAVVTAEQFIRRGGYVTIFPEGTIPDSKEPLRFRKGVARMSIETGAPVFPVHIVGGFDVLRENSAVPRVFVNEMGERCNVRVVIGKPIYPPQISKRLAQKKWLEVVEKYTAEIEAAVRSLTPENCVEETEMPQVEIITAA